jgi:hypothetical protein
MRGVRWLAVFILTGAFAARAGDLAIPESIRAEHAEIHAELEEATRAPGAVGAAAKELAAVLHPHFVREEQVAQPPLGLIGPLASGAAISDAAASEALAMTDTLRRELPRMLQEHAVIRAAVEKLRETAHAANAAKAEELAEKLALHAKTEEEVLYPAALLVGDALRARQKAR